MNTCNLCNKQFHNSELLQSNNDEFFCKQCFKYEYCSVSTKKKTTLANKCEGDSFVRPKKMFSQAELCILKQNREVGRKMIPSKRPLQCPHVDCNRYVSVFDLIAHFQHEHMEVPIAQTSLDARNPLTFFPRDIRYGVKQCLILLNVAPPVEDVNNTISGSVTEKQPAPITIAVLASRLAAAQLGDENNDGILEDEETNGLMSSNNDKIIIWTSSNIVCDYSYTVAVSTVSEDIRVKYYGPVLQLGNSPKKLCTGGHCLILSHFHFIGMSENGSRPLQLDVIIHSED